MRVGAAGVDRLLAPLVPMACPRVEGDVPAVFIVGAPRSGTTLFYQAMVHSYRFAYISNELARFPRSAPLVARFLGARRKSGSTGFSSSYGNTGGRAGPSEAGAFWDLVFPWSSEHAVDADSWPIERQRFVRRHVGALTRLQGAPFLCKNVWHSARLEALDRAFPTAAFIVMRRDPLLVAQSILKIQRQRRADGAGFWSVRPRGLSSKLDLDLPELVAWQIALTEQAIAEAREGLGAGRFIDVEYEAFCEEPNDTLQRVGDFLQGNGIAVEHRAQINERFEAHEHCGLLASERAEIEAVFADPSFAQDRLLSQTA